MSTAERNGMIESAETRTQRLKRVARENPKTTIWGGIAGVSIPSMISVLGFLKGIGDNPLYVQIIFMAFMLLIAVSLVMYAIETRDAQSGGSENE